MTVSGGRIPRSWWKVQKWKTSQEKLSISSLVFANS